MLEFTLDHNCLIDLDEQRPAAPSVRQLIAHHRAQRADVAVVAMAGSERRKDGGYPKTFIDFRRRLEHFDMNDVTVIPLLGYIDICFIERCLISGKDAVKVESGIHKVLFPGTALRWKDYAPQNGFEVTDRSSREYHRWRNRLCDVQAMWSHIHHGRDVFVTSDRNFLRAKRSKLIALGAGDIRTPDEASALLA
jgi:hypothetical protein